MSGTEVFTGIIQFFPLEKLTRNLGVAVASRPPLRPAPRLSFSKLRTLNLLIGQLNPEGARTRTAGFATSTDFLSWHGPLTYRNPGDRFICFHADQKDPIGSRDGEKFTRGGHAGGTRGWERDASSSPTGPREAGTRTWSTRFTTGSCARTGERSGSTTRDSRVITGSSTAGSRSGARWGWPSSVLTDSPP